jgi:hypothetical protein
MAITQTMCSSFKQEILVAVHDLASDTLKLALYTSSASLDATTTVYSSGSEVVASGYSAGGNTLTGASVLLDGTTATVTFANTAWTSSTIVARGALIYNSSKSNKAIAVLDFGSDKIPTAGVFTVQFPAATASSAVVRIG